MLVARTRTSTQQTARQQETDEPGEHEPLTLTRAGSPRVKAFFDEGDNRTRGAPVPRRHESSLTASAAIKRRPAWRVPPGLTRFYPGISATSTGVKR